VAFVLLPVSATGAIDSVDVIVGAALFLAIIAAIVFVPWDRVPRTLTIFPPLVYFGVVDLLRDATGGGASGYAALVLLPVLWVALYSGRAELIAVLAGVWSTFVIPILVDKTRYPEGDWRFAVLLTLLSAFIGFATQALVENVRLRARNLSAVMTSAAEGIITLTPEGHGVFVNPSAARMLGYEPSELEGRVDGDGASSSDAARLRQRGHGLHGHASERPFRTCKQQLPDLQRRSGGGAGAE